MDDKLGAKRGATARLQAKYCGGCAPSHQPGSAAAARECARLDSSMANGALEKLPPEPARRAAANGPAAGRWNNCFHALPPLCVSFASSSTIVGWRQTAATSAAPPLRSASDRNAQRCRCDDPLEQQRTRSSFFASSNCPYRRLCSTSSRVATSRARVRLFPVRRFYGLARMFAELDTRNLFRVAHTHVDQLH